jgi:hypothetical protein
MAVGPAKSSKTLKWRGYLDGAAEASPMLAGLFRAARLI